MEFNFILKKTHSFTIINIKKLTIISDWKDDIIIKRSMDAIEAQQYFANFFVNEARKNPNQLDEKLSKEIIYNGGSYRPHFGMPVHFFRNRNAKKVFIFIFFLFNFERYQMKKKKKKVLENLKKQKKVKEKK